MYPRTFVATSHGPIIDLDYDIINIAQSLKSHRFVTYDLMFKNNHKNGNTLKVTRMIQLNKMKSSVEI